MTPETFCEQFATFAEAPNGVAKLRELILQLAVQGKLGTQDVNDEPANVLAEQIVEYRKQSTGRTATMNLISADELGFHLPSGWIAARFGDLMVNRDGERVPVSREIREGRKGQYDYYGASGVIDSIDDFLFDKPLLLIGEDGANLINRSTPIAFIAHGKYWVNNHAHVLDGVSLDFLRYIELHINAIDLKPFVTGTAQPKMNQAKMNSIPIALPPLAEQRRIVGKVDQLLGLCDELAARQAARREARSALVGATLDRLVSRPRQSNSISPSPLYSGERGSGGEGLNRSKRRPPHPQPFSPEDGGEGSKDMDINRLRDHFDRLFDTPTTLPQLRQAILQLAVQGQLVPQDPNDEPVDVLCARIAKAKQALIDAGNAKASKFREPISADECPFQLPPNWRWMRLEELSKAIADGVHNTPRYVTKGIPFVTIRNLTAGPGISFSDLKYITVEDHREFIKRTHPERGDILITKDGTIGVVRVVETDIEFSIFVSVALIKPVVIAINYFIALALESSAIQQQIVPKGAALKHLHLVDLRKLMIPLAPLSEQKRIVSKVTELLSLCDALEAKLTQAESASNQLHSAAVHHLLNKPI